MASIPAVRVVRSGLVESVHLFDVAVADPGGRLVAGAGDPGRTVFARSSMKPLQAAVSISLAGLDFSDREVAVMCGSHNGEAVHVEAVRSLLARAGVGEEALRCPPAWPLDPRAARAAAEPRPILSNCSGKHAGMVAACRGQGWPLETYPEPDHPLQRRVLEAVQVAGGLDRVQVGVDGCGVPVHGLPLTALATLFARLAVPDRLGALEPHVRRARSAMVGEPYLVAGSDRVDTALMEAAQGVVVKGGAEGLACAALVERGLGLAVKVRDGGRRAVAPALIRALELLEAVGARETEALARFARPPVTGGGRSVGELAVELELVRP